VTCRSDHQTEIARPDALHVTHALLVAELTGPLNEFTNRALRLSRSKQARTPESDNKDGRSVKRPSFKWRGWTKSGQAVRVACPPSDGILSQSYLNKLPMVHGAILTFQIT
jgi:hypothetical protein